MNTSSLVGRSLGAVLFLPPTCLSTPFGHPPHDLRTEHDALAQEMTRLDQGGA